jgi:hypothetical protein
VPEAAFKAKLRAAQQRHFLGAIGRRVAVSLERNSEGIGIEPRFLKAAREALGLIAGRAARQKRGRSQNSEHSHLLLLVVVAAS